MLTATYIHIENINYKTESKLWGLGYKTWWHVIENPDNLPMKSTNKSRFIISVKKSIRKFMKDEINYFTDNMQHKDYWRILKHYPNEIGYVDIETDINGEITIIGLYIADKYIAYKSGENIAKLEWMFSLPRAVITFNGMLFDIPQIKKQYPYIKIPKLHFDLYKGTSSIGWAGGLKKLEMKFGFLRPDNIKKLNGYDAVKLWESYLLGNKLSLEILYEYNKYDVKNLKFLFNKFYDFKANRLEILA